LKRIEGLDFLRGFAIIIMFFDHVAAIAFSQGIEPFNVRFFARVAEPIFSLLFGYFLLGRNKRRLAFRLAEIFFVAVLINIFFYSVTGVFDILVDFLVIGIFYMVVGDALKYFFPVVFLTPIFPEILDYPLPFVLSQVSLGMLIREFNKERRVIFPFLVFLASAFFISVPLQYSIFFTLVAGVLVLIFSSSLRDFEFFPVNFMGKRPLLFYSLQYISAILIAILIVG
jgi:hypothetical protein